MNKEKLYNKIDSIKPRSAWSKGVKEYALELVEKIEHEEIDSNGLQETLLTGARNWKEYSYGGCACIYDSDIALRLSNKSELKKVRYDEKNSSVNQFANSKENWLDVQSRALSQACNLIKSNIG